jgi:hypothetical protein
VSEHGWATAVSLNCLINLLQGRLRAFGPRARKLRLFGCACCRRIWHLLLDERSRRAVEVSERFGDHRATEAERKEAALAALDARGADWDPTRNPAAHAAVWASNDSKSLYKIEGLVRWTAALAAMAERRAEGRELPNWNQATGSEFGWQVDYLRDILFNPFRLAPQVDPAWAAANGSAVQMLAKAIYEERAFDRLPILADALEEAGCNDAEILDHLRGPGPHVRGCWPVDLVLNRT